MEISKQIYITHCKLCTERYCCHGICIQVNNALVKEREANKNARLRKLL